MSDVKIKYVDSVMKWDDMERDEHDNLLRKDLQPGSASWMHNEESNYHILSFVCPCGCGGVCNVPASKGIKTEHAWVWNGDIERPTLTPSIQRISRCRWHGYLTDGVFCAC